MAIRNEATGKHVHPRGMTARKERFASPADAANALVKALRTNDLNFFVSITGQDFDRWMGAGDSERDAWERKNLVEDARRVHSKAWSGMLKCCTSMRHAGGRKNYERRPDAEFPPNWPTHGAESGQTR